MTSDLAAFFGNELKINTCHLMNNVLHSVNMARLVRVVCGFSVEMISVRDVRMCIQTLDSLIVLHSRIKSILFIYFLSFR